jgi:hypothetical protein
MHLKEIGWEDMDRVHLAENNHLSPFEAEHLNCLLKGKVAAVLNKLSTT